MRKLLVKILLYWLLLVIALVGCSSNSTQSNLLPKSTLDSAELNRLQDSQDQPSNRLYNSDEVVRQYYVCLKNYDYQKLTELVWDESVSVVFGESPNDFVGRLQAEHKDHGYELISFEITKSQDFKSKTCDITSKLYTVYCEYYMDGELKKETKNQLVILTDQGWKISINGYLGFTNLDFRENRVKPDQFGIKVCPECLLHFVNKTEMLLSIKKDRKRYPYLEVTTSIVEAKPTVLIVESDGNVYKATLPKSIVASHSGPKNPRFNVKLSDSEEVGIPATIKLQGLTIGAATEYEWGESWDYVICENGQFLNEQKPMMTGKFYYDYEKGVIPL